jgi:hypothetical protein
MRTRVTIDEVVVAESEGDAELFCDWKTSSAAREKLAAQMLDCRCRE